MDARTTSRQRQTSEARWLTFSGSLLIAGLLVNLAAKLVHPAGSEDSHREIFAKYAASDAWVAIHLLQYVGGLLAIAGLFVLCRLFAAEGKQALLSRLAAGATIATAAVLTLLQGLDGVALKEAVDAWAAATPADEGTTLATAEAIRWLEWGVQSYFRIVFGLCFALLSIPFFADGRHRSLAWLAASAGAVSMAGGVDVGYSGLESDVGAVVDVAFAVTAASFAIAVLAVGLSSRSRPAVAADPAGLAAG